LLDPFSHHPAQTLSTIVKQNVESQT